jgi:hypothetical protein
MYHPSGFYAPAASPAEFFRVALFEHSGPAPAPAEWAFPEVCLMSDASVFDGWERNAKVYGPEGMKEGTYCTPTAIEGAAAHRAPALLLAGDGAFFLEDCGWAWRLPAVWEAETRTYYWWTFLGDDASPLQPPQEPEEALCDAALQSKPRLAEVRGGIERWSWKLLPRELHRRRRIVSAWFREPPVQVIVNLQRRCQKKERQRELCTNVMVKRASRDPVRGVALRLAGRGAFLDFGDRALLDLGTLDDVALDVELEFRATDVAA